MDEMKTGLVLEGGAMRGMFTAGIIDVFMEEGIALDGVVGTSAGAAFGCNYKSGQIGRTIRYNKKYCRDKRFAGLSLWLTTGNLYGVEFGYRDIPERLDPFDKETFQKSPVEFYVVCTDVETGEAVYHQCNEGGREDIEWIRASSSMPLASRLVMIGGRTLLDGGIADSIAFRFMRERGYERNVVILTQPFGYIKKPNSLYPVMRMVYRKWPKFVEAIRTRHLRYNETLQEIWAQEKAGNAFVFCPKDNLEIGYAERDPEVLERVYQAGRQLALEKLPQLKAWLQKGAQEG